MAELPQSDDEMVAACLDEYHNLFTKGAGPKVVEDAKLRLIWALVHSHSDANVKRGLGLADEAMAAGSSNQKDLKYLSAVASYKLGSYTNARRELKEVLQVG